MQKKVVKKKRESELSTSSPRRSQAKGMVISQLMILLIGIFAFAYILSEINLVGAVGEEGEDEPPAEKPAPSTTFNPVPFVFTLKGVEKITPNQKIISEAGKAVGESAVEESAKFGFKTILKNAAVASTIFFAIQLLGPLITSDRGAINIISTAASIGYFTASTLSAKAVAAKLPGFLGDKTGVLGLTWGAAIITIGVIAVIVIWGFKKTAEETVQYSCFVWDAPLGGNDCDKCNQGSLPCTEYMCKSLGQSCELINKGTGEEKCVWLNKDDVRPPEIRPWNDALLNSDYKYKEDTAISPPDRGVFIRYKEGCIQAFTPFKFGITLDEPARCKISPDRKRTFDEMSLSFGGSSTAKYNHSMEIVLPSKESLEAENITLQN